MAQQKQTVAEREAAMKAEHAAFQKNKRNLELEEALDAGWLPQGTRLVDPANPEEGRTFVFGPDEGKVVNEALRKVIAARKKENEA